MEAWLSRLALLAFADFQYPQPGRCEWKFLATGQASVQALDFQYPQPGRCEWKVRTNMYCSSRTALSVPSAGSLRMEEQHCSRDLLTGEPFSTLSRVAANGSSSKPSASRSRRSFQYPQPGRCEWKADAIVMAATWQNFQYPQPGRCEWKAALFGVSLDSIESFSTLSRVAANGSTPRRRVAQRKVAFSTLSRVAANGSTTPR